MLFITFPYKPNLVKWLATLHDHEIQPYEYFNAMEIVHIVMQIFEAMFQHNLHPYLMECYATLYYATYSIITCTT